MFMLSVLSINLVFYNISIAYIFIYFSINPSASADSVIAIPQVIWVLIGIPLVIFQVVKRLHDRGKSGVHLLLFLIPLWNLAECYKAFLTKGEPLFNRSGALPSSISDSTRLIVFIFIFVLLCVLLWWFDL